MNLMSLSIYKKLGLGEVKLTSVSLQLVDRSIKYHHGILEYLLIKVGKFIFLTNFIVLDMEEVQEIPFLATEVALINVKNEKLTECSR